MKYAFVLLIALGAYMLFSNHTPTPAPATSVAAAASVKVATVTTAPAPTADHAAYGLRAPLDRTRDVLAEVRAHTGDDH